MSAKILHIPDLCIYNSIYLSIYLYIFNGCVSLVFKDLAIDLSLEAASMLQLIQAEELPNYMAQGPKHALKVIVSNENNQ